MIAGGVEQDSMGGRVRDGDFREVENQMKVNGGWGVVQHGIWGRELLGCRAGFHGKGGGVG